MRYRWSGIPLAEYPGYLRPVCVQNGQHKRREPQPGCRSLWLWSVPGCNPIRCGSARHGKHPQGRIVFTGTSFRRNNRQLWRPQGPAQRRYGRQANLTYKLCLGRYTASPGADDYLFVVQCCSAGARRHLHCMLAYWGTICKRILRLLPSPSLCLWTPRPRPWDPEGRTDLPPGPGSCTAQGLSWAIPVFP